MIGLFFKSFFVAFSGAAMPGPLLVLTIAQVTRRGFWTAPLIIVGHSILEIGIVVGLIFGLSRLLGNQIVQGAIGIAGGSFLIWMGLTMMRTIPHLTLKLKVEPEKKTIQNPVIGGILVSLSNPYWTIWWVTFGLALLTEANALGTTGVGVFYVGHILGDFVWYGFIAMMLTLGRKLINDIAYRMMIGICAAFILLLGATFIYSGIKFLIS